MLEEIGSIGLFYNLMKFYSTELHRNLNRSFVSCPEGKCKNHPLLKAIENAVDEDFPEAKRSVVNVKPKLISDFERNNGSNVHVILLDWIYSLPKEKIEFLNDRFHWVDGTETTLAFAIWQLKEVNGIEAFNKDKNVFMKRIENLIENDNKKQWKTVKESYLKVANNNKNQHETIELLSCVAAHMHKEGFADLLLKSSVDKYTRGFEIF